MILGIWVGSELRRIYPTARLGYAGSPPVAEIWAKRRGPGRETHDNARGGGSSHPLARFAPSPNHIINDFYFKIFMNTNFTAALPHPETNSSGTLEKTAATNSAATEN
jgi:hypothetical protein